MSAADDDGGGAAPPRVVILGGGFAGLNTARALAAKPFDVTIIDRRNHHLFQPLLYQVAMAGLSPADIAAPIRQLLAAAPNIDVLQDEVVAVDLVQRRVVGRAVTRNFDYLVVACGARPSYFGNDNWEPTAPSLKTIEQATEIRRRVLLGFERAERADDPEERRRALTFAVIGGGPTGVELAGAIGEMSRYTLARDFRRIDPKQTRIVLIEAGRRILPTFPDSLADRAARDLEALGVHIWTDARVAAVDERGLNLGSERLEAGTILWAAGVEAETIARKLGAPTVAGGRVAVNPDLSLPGHAHVFVVGDAAHVVDHAGQPLPGTAPVALQQGRYVGRLLCDEAAGRPRTPFVYRDKGQMATIGRSRAVVHIGRLTFGGFAAWLAWLAVHIYYLTGFKNRLFVVLTWAWSYLTFRRGARLIVEKEWRTIAPPSAPPS